MDQVNEAFLSYYKILLGTSMCIRVGSKEEVLNMEPKLSSDHIASLERSYTRMEIKEAMMSILGNKSLGPDRFGGHFFKDHG